MNINKDGQLDIPSRWTFRVCEEFGWNVEEMADEILDLRKEIEEGEKEVAKLEEELDKANKMSGEQF